ncbi:hypothetical protein CYMTET_36111, partial [Cymbomonas tetramitiformis]
LFYDNNLDGTLPTELGELTGMMYLWLNNNNLEGTLPTQLGALTQLTNMYAPTKGGAQWGRLQVVAMEGGKKP